jgi:hypothetical protein
MQSTATPAPSSPSSFAGFLAALTQPARSSEDDGPTQPASRASIWSDELLAEDVATLSYERALRSHARYRANDPGVIQDEPASAVQADAPAPQPAVVPSVPEKILKQSSITIRLSSEEDAQLRKRALQAGLTVSAYIRSCTFEAEALRALVKDTITQFRTNSAPPQQDTKPPNRRRRWSSLFWPMRRAAHSTVSRQV